ncbi:hypothetical protein [Modestobacter sp. DSM 44400]|uniref:hypothetical protein n=1 Tax=Modestobacter sp. DSM 44400 TaxID=1550230 RepID=UPI001115329F|nr:hypothetical protein [Modestobacter sp. DSM 44400]
MERIVLTPAVQPAGTTPRHDGWIDVLRELSRQLDRGLLYDRDLPGVASALDEALASLRRRTRPR